MAVFEYTDMGKYADYQEKWIAIDGWGADEKVVGVGDDAVEAMAEAERQGYKDAALMRVPRLDRSYVFTPF